MVLAARPKVTVIIPAHNEEQAFARVRGLGYFDALRKWHGADRENRNVVFVNDGSKDKTAELVRSEGFSVINSGKAGKNLGKGGAVITGLKHAYDEHGADIAVLLDADILNLVPEKIDAMVKPLLAKPRKWRKPPNMVIGSYHEELDPLAESGSMPAAKSSGQRAIRLSAISAVFKSSRKEEAYREIMAGFGLELGLNELLGANRVVETRFKCAQAFRNSSEPAQKSDSQSAWSKLKDREYLARQFNEFRVMVHSLPEDQRAAARKKLMEELRVRRARNKYLQ